MSTFYEQMCAMNAKLKQQESRYASVYAEVYVIAFVYIVKNQQMYFGITNDSLEKQNAC